PTVELLEALPDLVAGPGGRPWLALDAMPLGQGFGIGHGLMVAASPAEERGVERNRGWVELSFPPGARDAHSAGRLAQRESACLTRKRSLVQTQRRPPSFRGPVVEWSRTQPYQG